jgi:hypothetical protein
VKRPSKCASEGDASEMVGSVLKSPEARFSPSFLDAPARIELRGFKARVGKLLVTLVGADASGPQTTLQRSVGEPQKLVRESRARERFGRESRARERFGSHLVMETSRSVSDSTGESHLVRNQGEDLW